MNRLEAELRHVKPGVWSNQFKHEAAKLGVKIVDLAGAHWLKERGTSPKQAADILHGRLRGRGMGGIPKFNRPVPAEGSVMNSDLRRAIAVTLKQQGREDLARLFVPAKKQVAEANMKALLKAAETLLRGVSGIPGPQGKRLKSMVSDVRSTLEMLDAQKKLG